MKREVRGHPLMILDYLYPYLFLLILPTIRGLIHFFRTGQYDKLLNGEILAFALALAVALLKWRNFRLTVDENYSMLRIRYGLFYRHESIIRQDRISCYSSERNPVLSLLSAVTFKIDTEAGRNGKADFSFKLYARDFRSIARILPVTTNSATHRTPFSKLLIMSAATSSAVSGILIGIPLLNNAAKLFGFGLQELIFAQINDVSNRFSRYIPPIVNVITLIFLAAYLFSFFYTLFRNLNFRVRVGREDISVRAGILSRRETTFKKSAVNNVVIQQSFVLRMIRHYVLKVSIAGYSEKKGENAVLIPAARRQEMRKQLTSMFYYKPPQNYAVRPPIGSLGRFLLWPSIWFVLIPVLTLLIADFLPAFRELLLFLMFALMILLLYAMTLGINNYRYGGLSLGNGQFSAHASRRFSIRELYCDSEKIGCWRIRCFPADLRTPICKVRITIRSESAESIYVRHLSLDSMASLFEREYQVPKNCFNL